MRAAFICIIFLATAWPVSAQPGWKDCATAQQYHILHEGEWQQHTGIIKLCYDTHAFTLKTPEKTWYTGIVRYAQHLENGYLVEDFFSEDNEQYPGSELHFNIVRSTPAVITIQYLATGDTWQIYSAALTEVKLEAANK